MCAHVHVNCDYLVVRLPAFAGVTRLVHDFARLLVGISCYANQCGDGKEEKENLCDQPLWTCCHITSWSVEVEMPSHLRRSLTFTTLTRGRCECFLFYLFVMMCYVLGGTARRVMS